jgi:hypothetical protein
MKKLLACLCIASLIAGCATKPSSPKPHETKYTFQCLHVSIPEDVLKKLNVRIENNTPQDNSSQPSGVLPTPNPTQTQIDEILKNPKSTTTEFPIVYAGLGMPATNAQTETIELAVDANVVDGKVVYETEPRKQGKTLSIAVQKNEDGVVNYEIHAEAQKIAGYDSYKTKTGQQIKMPFFDTKELHTRLMQKPDSWLALGGLIKKQHDGPLLHTLFLVRIISPTTENQSTLAEEK